MLIFMLAIFLYFDFWNNKKPENTKGYLKGTLQFISYDLS